MPWRAYLTPCTAKGKGGLQSHKLFCLSCGTRNIIFEAYNMFYTLMSLLGQSKNCLTKCHKELPVMGGLEKTIRTGQAPAAASQHSPWVFSSSYLKDCWVVLVFNSHQYSYLLGIYPLEPICTFYIHNSLLEEVSSFTYKLHEELIPCVCFEFSYPIDLMSASSSIQTIQLFPFCYVLGSNHSVELSHIFISHFSLFQPWRVLL